MTSFKLKEHILENFRDIYEYNYLEFRRDLIYYNFFLPFIYVFNWRIIALQCCVGLTLPFFNWVFLCLFLFYQKPFDIFLSLARSIVVSAII